MNKLQFNWIIKNHFEETMIIRLNDFKVSWTSGLKSSQDDEILWWWLIKNNWPSIWLAWLSTFNLLNSFVGNFLNRYHVELTLQSRIFLNIVDFPGLHGATTFKIRTVSFCLLPLSRLYCSRKSCMTNTIRIFFGLFNFVLKICK